MIMKDYFTAKMFEYQLNFLVFSQKSLTIYPIKYYKPNEKITVRFRVGLASLFDAESGERL